MKKRLGSVRPLPCLLALGVLIGMTSCRTLPEAPYPDVLDWLPPSSNLVLRISVPGNESLADLVLSSVGVDTAKMADIKRRTALLALGMETDGAWDSFDELPVHLIAVGAWPRGLMGGILGEEWTRSGPHRWEGPTALTMAAVSREEILLSRGHLDEMILRRKEAVAGSLPSTRGDDFPDIDLVVRITGTQFIDTLTPVMAGGINRIDLGLKRHDAERYSAFLSLYPTDERLTGALALAMRIALAARFGTSSNRQERNLFSELSLDIDAGEIRIEFPPMTMNLLKGLTADFTPMAE